MIIEIRTSVGDNPLFIKDSGKIQKWAGNSNWIYNMKSNLLERKESMQQTEKVQACRVGKVTNP